MTLALVKFFFVVRILTRDLIAVANFLVVNYTDLYLIRLYLQLISS